MLQGEEDVIQVERECSLPASLDVHLLISFNIDRRACVRMCEICTTLSQGYWGKESIVPMFQT